MAVKYIGNGILLCLSTDTKPTTYPVGSLAIETDTGKTYKFGTTWSIGGISLPSTGRKIGRIQSTASSIFSDGMLSSMTSVGTISGGIDVAGGNSQYLSATSAAATDGLNAGIFTTSARTALGLNPRFTIRIKNNNAATLNRFFVGFSSALVAPVAGDDFLASLFGCGIGCASGDTNFTIIHNNNTTTVFTPFATPLAASTTNVHHTYEIIGDNANSRFGASYDGGPYTYVSSAIPVTGTGLAIWIIVQTHEAATHAYVLKWAELEHDAG